MRLKVAFSMCAVKWVEWDNNGRRDDSILDHTIVRCFTLLEECLIEGSLGVKIDPAFEGASLRMMSCRIFNYMLNKSH